MAAAQVVPPSAPSVESIVLLWKELLKDASISGQRSPQLGLRKLVGTLVPGTCLPGTKFALAPTWIILDSYWSYLDQLRQL